MSRSDAREPVPLRDLAEAAAGAGVAWALEPGPEGELNVNLVRFPEGDGVGEHVNAAVDVLIVGIAGEGTVVVDGAEHALAAGTLVHIPRGARRSTRAGRAGFAYLTVHRRRGPLTLT